MSLVALSTPSANAVAPTRVDVSTASQLSSALAGAMPGSTIVLADGEYRGHFTLRRPGTADAPIRITGSRGAVLDGGGMSSGYGLYLDKADYAQVDGFTVRNAKKAVVLDQSSHVTLQGLDLHTTAEEVLLVRNFSRDNLISGNQIHDSGNITPGYGEGVYLGLAKSNWSAASSRTGGKPDTSDRNSVVGNNIYDTTAENVDIKEGTSGGLIADNSFDGSGLAGVHHGDSWVDVKGNGYTVQDNTGVNSGRVLVDGYQTHVQLPGWGINNVFLRNKSSVNGTGYAINIKTPSTGNVVYSSNTLTSAAKGLTNITTTP